MANTACRVFLSAPYGTTLNETPPFLCYLNAAITKCVCSALSPSVFYFVCVADNYGAPPKSHLFGIT